MKKVLRSATALAAAMIAMPAAAHATDGWYGKVDVGFGFKGDMDIKAPTPAPVTLNGKQDFDSDWNEDVGLGYAFAGGPGLWGGLRFEGEIGHKWNNFKVTPTEGGFGAHAYTGMVNAYWDFNKNGVVQPYIGGGVGAAKIVAHATTPSANQILQDSSTQWAYQGLAGVGIALSNQLVLDVGYRYFVSPGGTYKGTKTTPLPSGATSYDADYKQQAVTVGLRWQFASPVPPPPPPAPPPPPPPPPVEKPAPVVCPAQDFKVYFEWDRSNLNQAGMDTINAAVARAKQCNVSTLHVAGYTDTSGSVKYNLGLSQRRATVVADALTAAGIPSGVITTEGLGKTNLAKPTKDGVREPLNRRSEVTISFR